jgi:hypothetical protein
MSETSEIESNKTEKDYLELGDCFKEIVQQKDNEIMMLSIKYLKCFKLMMMSYTFFRMFDVLLSRMHFADPEIDNIKMNTEFIRSEISDYLDEINNVDSDEDE